MKVELPAKAILAAVRQVQPATLKNKQQPVLGCVLVEADDGSVTLSATNLEHGVRVRLALTVPPGRPGRVAVSAERLAAVLAEAGTGPVSLDARDELLRVGAGAARFELPTYRADQFPEIPTPPADVPGLTVAAADLARLIAHTAFAADTKDTAARYALTGVLFHVAGPSLTLIATDSKRLAVDAAAAEADHGADTKVDRPHLVPARLLRIVEGVLPGGPEPVRIVLRPNEAFFTAVGCQVWVRLVEGRFPPWEKIMPKALKGTATLPADEFRRKLRQAAIMADRTASRVDVTFAPAKVRLQARGAETGESDVWMDAPYEGPGVAVAFNPAFVEEFLASTGEPTVTLHLKDESSPVMFTAGPKQACVIMTLIR